MTPETRERRDEARRDRVRERGGEDTWDKGLLRFRLEQIGRWSEADPRIVQRSGEISAFTATVQARGNV